MTHPLSLLLISLLSTLSTPLIEKKKKKEKGKKEGRRRSLRATSGLGASSSPYLLPWCLVLGAWTWSLQERRSSPFELGLKLLRGW